MRYKGSLIMARPRQIALTGLWTVDLEIRRSGRRQAFSLAERFATEDEASAGGTSLAQTIIDGNVPASLVDTLPSHSMSRRIKLVPERVHRTTPWRGWRKFGGPSLFLALTALMGWIGRYEGRTPATLGIAGISISVAGVLFWLSLRKPH